MSETEQDKDDLFLHITPKDTCEHKWDGPDYESEGGLCFSVTCSRCGITAMSHSMRNAP